MTRLVGDREFKRKLQSLMGSVRAGAELGIQEAAGLVVDEAKELVHVRTGALRESIHTEIEVDHRDEITVAAGPDAALDHAEEQEFGSDHNYAHPFMRPAIDHQQKAALQRVEKRVLDGIKSVAK